MNEILRERQEIFHIVRGDTPAMFSTARVIIAVVVPRGDNNRSADEFVAEFPLGVAQMIRACSRSPISYLVVVVLLLIAGASFLANGRTSAADDPPRKFPADEFAGKIVTVYPGGADSASGHILENVEFKDVGGRLMMIGVGSDTGQAGNWTVGVRVGIAWDNVRTYCVMTKEDFEAKRKQFSAGAAAAAGNAQ